MGGGGGGGCRVGMGTVFSDLGTSGMPDPSLGRRHLGPCPIASWDSFSVYNGLGAPLNSMTHKHD